MFQIIEDAQTWRKIVSKFTSFDVYHTWDYHQISKKAGEEPVMIYYEEKDNLVALPFLKRQIPETEFYDLTSVYGYVGPICHGLGKNFKNSKFSKELDTFLKQNNIVSVFSRLNPFIPFQDVILNEIGEIIPLGPIVNIDLTQEVELQRQNYSKTTKRYVNRLRRLCNVVKSNTKDDISKFMELYTSTMNRVEATDYYYFDEEYYNRFFESKEFQVDLLFAQLKDTGELICGAMMIKTNDIVQYHLSGTSTESLNITPLRLLIDETRLQATNNGFHYFNLGGGLGSQEDSLFYFKSSFSKDYKHFSVWKYVVNNKIYNELSKNRRMEMDDKSEFDKSNFFPSYRI